jgi:hypothetical protein
MLEKISGAAERAATSVSRREVLWRLGRGAMAVSAALAGLALTAANKPPSAPRVCNAESGHECLDKKEGDICAAGRYYGVCRGPKQRGKGGETSVPCYCDLGVDNPR